MLLIGKHTVNLTIYQRTFSIQLIEMIQFNFRVFDPIEYLIIIMPQHRAVATHTHTHICHWRCDDNYRKKFPQCK